MSLMANSVWRFEDVAGLADGPYRLLKTYAEWDAAVIFQLVDTKRMIRPQVIGLGLLDLYVEQNIAKAYEFVLPTFMLSADADIPETHRAKRDAKFALVSSFQKQAGLLLDMASRQRGGAFSNFVVESGKSTTAILRALNLFWKYGQQRNALLPAFERCGAHGTKREAGRIKRGAPRKSKLSSMSMPEGVNCYDRDHLNILKALKKYHLRPEPLSLRATYEKMKKDSYRDEIEAAEIEGRPERIISENQFYYWAKRLLDPNDVTVKQHSEGDWQRNYRGLKGHATQHAPVPGSCFEVDATIADVHLVSRFDPHQPIGRPVIYAVTDKASRMIVGFHISLEFASWKAGRQALLNAFLHKKAVCAKYGVNIHDSDYPCHHVPQSLLVDRGEFIFQGPEDALAPISSIKIAAPYRADMKGIVERRFGILNERLFHQLEGSTFGRTKNRGDVAPELKAELTLERLARMLIDDVMEHNRSQFNDLATSPLLMKHNLTPTPINFWRVHLQEHRHSLSIYDETFIRANLSPPVKAVVTPSGIEFDGLLYTCNSADREGWTTKARNGGRWSIEARADLDNSSQLFVRADRRTAFEPCRILPKFSDFADVPMAEIHFWQDWRKQKKLSGTIAVADIQAHDRREAMERAAKREKLEMPDNKSRKQKRIDKTKYRNAELQQANVVSIHTGETLPSMERGKPDKPKSAITSIMEDMVEDWDRE